MNPFLSIVTRHYYKRPNMYKLCCESVDRQKDQDLEHIILRDDIGVGFARANGFFYENRDKVKGDYVFMLDDDNVLITDDFVTDLKEIVKIHSPEMIFIRNLIDGVLYPSSRYVWGKDKLIINHIDTANVVVKKELWQKHIINFLQRKAGDFFFIDSVFRTKPKIYWQDKIYSKSLMVGSKGESEENINISKNNTNVDKIVTGVVVSHNTKDLLKTAITSIRKHHPKMKLIVVDGSDKTDSCYSYIRTLANSNTRVFHITGNIGHGKGLNYGIQYIDTPYLLVFDSDIEMVYSPIEEMLNMMEDMTWGVGSFEMTDLGGHIWGTRKDKMNEGPMKYLHPYFCLIQMKEYKKYSPFIHHGSPAVQTMLEIYRKGLSEVVLKEFKDLCYSDKKEKYYIKHRKRGTRDIRIKNHKDEIEGSWEKVLDPGENRITCITCTGDRPEAFYLCKKWMVNQKVKPSQWIIIDDGKIPISENLDASWIQYIRREPSYNDPKQTMILNLKLALNYVNGNKIFICEDDEYYSPDYIKEMLKLLDRYEVVGIGRSRYYHIGTNTYHIHSNMGHASLAQTCFRCSFLPELKQVIDGTSFLDIRIWKIINPGKVNLEEIGRMSYISKNGRGYIFDDSDNPLYVGMKGLPGRSGIGSGHKGVGIKDAGMLKLKEWIIRAEDFTMYEQLKNKSRRKEVDIQPDIFATLNPPPRSTPIIQFERRPETLLRNKIPKQLGTKHYR